MSVTEMKTASDPHQQKREDLAAALRWAARYDWHEGIANHFSLAIDPEGKQFLLNPYGVHFSRMRASDLLLLDANNPASIESDLVEPTAWCIHGAMHRNLPQARCILHVHPRWATALSSLRDASMPPIDQNTMRYFNRIAVDDGFDGMGLDEEAERLTTMLGNKSVLLMGNHGVMTVGETVAQAFDLLYYFERACENLITALSSGRELRVVFDAIAEKTAQQWEEMPWMADAHFDALKRILDEEEPAYRD